MLAVPVAALVVIGVGQARAQPDLAPAGAGTGALVVQLGAGLALAIAAVATARRQEFAVSGALLVAAAGLGLRALPTPADGAALFTLALVGAGVPAAAVAHVALLHPSGRTAGSLDRVAVAAGYAVTVGLLGLVPALVTDPSSSGCFACPHNLLLAHADASLASVLAQWMPRGAALAEIMLAPVVILRLLRRPPAARALATPVCACAVAALALSAWENLRSADGLAGTATDRILWMSTSAALGLVAAGLALRPLQAIRLRAALGRLTLIAQVSLYDIQEALSRGLEDPDVRLLVPHPETGTPTTPDGGSAPADPPPARVRTAVERQSRIVAWVEHRADLRATPELLATAMRAAGLTLEREALRLGQRLQAQEMHESTLRLVSAGEAERRRLERDLHDGAQQRLLALGIALARTRAAAPPGTAQVLIVAEQRVAALRDALRRIAHGIHSVTLAEGGLAEAVLALVQASPRAVAVEALPERSASPLAEAAIYRLVAATLRIGGDARVRVAIRAHGGELRATIRVPGGEAARLTDALAHVGARIAALGGSLTVDHDGTVSAHVPMIATAPF